MIVFFSFLFYFVETFKMKDSKEEGKGKEKEKEEKEKEKEKEKDNHTIDSEPKIPWSDEALEELNRIHYLLQQHSEKLALDSSIPSSSPSSTPPTVSIDHLRQAATFILSDLSLSPLSSVVIQQQPPPNTTSGREKKKGPFRLLRRLTSKPDPSPSSVISPIFYDFHREERESETFEDQKGFLFILILLLSFSIIFELTPSPSPFFEKIASSPNSPPKLFLLYSLTCLQGGCSLLLPLVGFFKN